MALTLQTTLKNTLADAIDTAIGAAGYMELTTASNVEVATLTFSNPAFGSASGGTISVTSPPIDDTSATGSASPVTKFRIFASGAVLQLEGAVATAASDLNISSTTIDAGDTVRLNSFSITVP